MDVTDLLALEWLHEFTHVGYGLEMVVLREHWDTVVGLYKEGLTPQQAFDKYVGILALSK